MLAFIYRIIHDFEQEHGMNPNILYLNQLHCEHLKAAFSDDYTMQTITRLLHVELIIDPYCVHPHVAWSQMAQRQMAS